jgi:hypothetical protein
MKETKDYPPKNLNHELEPNEETGGNSPTKADASSPSCGEPKQPRLPLESSTMLCDAPGIIANEASTDVKAIATTAKNEFFEKTAQDIPFPTELQRTAQSTPGAFPQIGMGSTRSSETSVPPHSAPTRDGSQRSVSADENFSSAGEPPLLAATLVEDTPERSATTETTGPNEAESDKVMVVAVAEPVEQRTDTEKAAFSRGASSKRWRILYGVLLIAGIFALAVGVTLALTVRTSSESPTTSSSSTALGSPNGTNASVPDDTNTPLLNDTNTNDFNEDVEQPIPGNIPSSAPVGPVVQSTHLVAWESSCMDEKVTAEIQCGTNEILSVQEARMAECTIQSDQGSNRAICLPLTMNGTIESLESANGNDVREIAMVLFQCTGVEDRPNGPVRARLVPTRNVDTTAPANMDWLCVRFNENLQSAIADTVPATAMADFEVELYIVLGDFCLERRSQGDINAVRHRLRTNTRRQLVESNVSDLEVENATGDDTSEDWRLQSFVPGSCQLPARNLLMDAEATGAAENEWLQVCYAFDNDDTGDDDDDGNDANEDELVVVHASVSCRHEIGLGPSRAAIWNEFERRIRPPLIWRELWSTTMTGV